MAEELLPSVVLRQIGRLQGDLGPTGMDGVCRCALGAKPLSAMADDVLAVGQRHSNAGTVTDKDNNVQFFSRGCRIRVNLKDFKP